MYAVGIILSLALRGWAHSACQSHECAALIPDQTIGGSLLQLGHLGRRGSADATCVPMRNRGTYFTVEVRVGTPEQKLDLVADTGSNMLIIASCACKDFGLCHDTTSCFRGSQGKSSSFHLENPENPTAMMVTFGSGTIGALIATDLVSVGSVTTNMSDSVLLMIDDSKLKISGVSFEGILGLGIPGAEKALSGNAVGTDAGAETGHTTAGSRLPQPSQGGAVQGLKDFVDALRRSIFGTEVASATVAAPQVVPNQEPDARDVGGHGAAMPKSFLGKAGISNFAMCFDEREEGSLRLDVPKSHLAHQLGSVGVAHWGLGLNRMVIGSGHDATPLSLCSVESMKSGQQTPCGMIPDSGSTMIMGPTNQILELYAAFCDGWARCRANASATSAGDRRRSALLKTDDSLGGSAGNADVKKESSAVSGEVRTKAKSFLSVLYDCEAWLHDSDVGLRELPPWRFELTGAGGEAKEIELSGWAYVLETTEEDVNYTYKHIPFFGDIPVKAVRTGKTRKVCSPAIGKMDYPTTLNGPVWILGTPLFYEYEVGYDLKAAPPALAFTQLGDSGCGSCSSDTSLVEVGKVATTGESRRVRSVRYISGPVRVPLLDVSSPL